MLLLGLVLALACSTVRAQFVVTGFGLSGSPTVLDSVVSPGEEVWVLLRVEVPAGWTIEGVGQSERPRFQLSGFYYDVEPPAGEPSAGQTLQVDSTSFVVDNQSNPPLVSFRVTLPADIPQHLISLQLGVSVFGPDTNDSLNYSEFVTSLVPVLEIEAVQDAIDNFHKPYLGLQPASASRPVIITPAGNGAIGRVFTLRYNQPLDADRRTLVLEMREVLEIGPVVMHYLFLSDTLAGDNKQIVVNGLNLGQTDGVDSLGGPSSLNHESTLRLKLYYNIAGTEGEPSDTAIVENLTVDLQTETPTLTEPRVGSESPPPDVRVIYRLPEDADTVQLKFELDTLSLVGDIFSPHILTLEASLGTAGEHYVILDGSEIGSEGPYVLHSNNGPEDELISQALYNVSLIYGDNVDNPSAVVSNYGYIWPVDLTTVPPRMLAPISNTSDNSSFWVQFELPEQPLPGSVYLSFSAIPSYPGSPHLIFLGDLGSSGVTGLTLNAQALDLSGPPVTSVEGGTALHHGTRYLIRINYQDFRGNDESSSTARSAIYDGATETPTLLLPSDADSFSFAGNEVFYSQPEIATPGTVRLIIEQTGGPEQDLFSPHVLYLSDADSGEQKSVTVSPAFVGAGPGIDSVHNAGSLVARGIYRMIIAYQDRLLNEEASDFVQDLYFPSGSSVVVRGNTLTTNVIPGGSHIPLMHLALASGGESALRGVRLGVEGSVTGSDVISNRMILWSSIDSLLQTAFDTPLDTLDNWLSGDMSWDSLSMALDEADRHVIVSGSFDSDANSANSIYLVLRTGADIDCGGDPVYCGECPIGMPDIALPVQVSSLFVEQDTTFSSLVVYWIAESEFNTLGFRLWRSDSESLVNEIVSTYADSEELYGRGNAATAKRYRYVDRNLRNGLTYTYTIDAVGMDGLTVFPVGLSASGTPANPPSSFAINRIYPNPFNLESTIEFVVPYTSTTEVTIYNLLGQPVRTLINAQLAPSVYRSHWDGSNDLGMSVPSGLYIVRLKAAGRFDTAQKLLLIR